MLDEMTGWLGFTTITPSKNAENSRPLITPPHQVFFLENVDTIFELSL